MLAKLSSFKFARFLQKAKQDVRYEMDKVWTGKKRKTGAPHQPNKPVKPNIFLCS